MRARQAAIDAGWLHYEPGTKSIAGKYWVTIPTGLSLETPQRNGTANGLVGNESERNQAYSRNESERKDDLPATKRNPKRNGKGTPFNPIPNNNPRESVSFSKAQEVVDTVNESLSRGFRLTPSRKRLIASRLKDDYWQSNWRQAISQAAASDFLNGRTDRGNWRMDIDFFLKPDTVTKILEGKYDNKDQQIDTARPF